MFKEEEIKKVAALARLKLSATEITQFGADLTAILDFVEQLKTLPVEAIPPASNISGALNVAREDVVERPVSQSEPEKLLAQAPDRKGDFVKVKAILK